MLVQYACRIAAHGYLLIWVRTPSGAGKSTLMRMLAGKDDQFDGELQRAPGITVSHLEQVCWEPNSRSNASTQLALLH